MLHEVTDMVHNIRRARSATDKAAGMACTAQNRVQCKRHEHTIRCKEQRMVGREENKYADPRRHGCRREFENSALGKERGA